MGEKKLSEQDSKMILIVDDEVLITEAYAAYLKSSNYRAVIMNSAQDAWQALDKYKFDLIITDLVMPYLDGEEFIKVIRKNPNHERTPVIIASGHSNAVHESKSNRDPILFLLKKPFNKGEFLKKIDDILK